MRHLFQSFAPKIDNLIFFSSFLSEPIKNFSIFLPYLNIEEKSHTLCFFYLYLPIHNFHSRDIITDFDFFNFEIFYHEIVANLL